MTEYSIGLTEEQLEEIAAQHDAGTCPVHTSAPVPGRPRLYDEEFETNLVPARGFAYPRR